MMAGKCGRWLKAGVLALGLLGAEAQAGKLVVEVRDEQNRPVKDAVAYFTLPGKPPAPAAKTRVMMDQRDKEFVPHVLAVQVGTEVVFPNSDNIRHHVYSLGGGNAFELPLYPNGARPSIQFKQAGAASLGCNIHDWMLGYVYVVDSPWFAVSGVDGRAQVQGMPDKSGKLKVWHPRLVGGESAVHEMEVTPGKGQVIPVRLKLKPERPRKRPDNFTSDYD
jgi:plastocyanin